VHPLSPPCSPHPHYRRERTCDRAAVAYVSGERDYVRQ
jgi:hypothetical protein